MVRVRVELVGCLECTHSTLYLCELKVGVSSVLHDPEVCDPPKLLELLPEGCQETVLVSWRLCSTNNFGLEDRGGEERQVCRRGAQGVWVCQQRVLQGF